MAHMHIITKLRFHTLFFIFGAPRPASRKTTPRFQLPIVVDFAAGAHLRHKTFCWVTLCWLTSVVRNGHVVLFAAKRSRAFTQGSSCSEGTLRMDGLLGLPRALV